MKIFNVNDYNGIHISFYEKLGMCPNGFDYKINLFCDNNYIELNIHPYKCFLHKEIKNIKINRRIMEMDYIYFSNIYNRLKNIDFSIFLYDEDKIYDDSIILFKIKRNKFTINVNYYYSLTEEENCNKNIYELNNIFNELKQKINFNEWCYEIIKRYNL